METNTVCERIEFARKEKRKSYQALAILIGGITGDGVRKAIIRNRLKPRYVECLSEALGLSERWLFTGQGDPFIKNKQGAPYTTKMLDPNVWLQKLKASKKLLDNDLGLVIEYSEQVFCQALEAKLLSFNQVKRIAQHYDVLDDFHATYGIEKVSVEEFAVENAASTTIEGLIAKAASKKIRKVIEEIERLMEGQNVIVGKLSVTLNMIKNYRDFPTASNLENDVEEAKKALEILRKRSKERNKNRQDG